MLDYDYKNDEDERNEKKKGVWWPLRQATTASSTLYLP